MCARMKCVHSLYNRAWRALPIQRIHDGIPDAGMFDENITISYFMAMSLRNCSTPGRFAWRQPNLRSQDAWTRRVVQVQH